MPEIIGHLSDRDPSAHKADSDRDWVVRKMGSVSDGAVHKQTLDGLVKLSEQGKCKNMKLFDLNIIDLLVAEFRESVRPAIKQIIALLNDRDWTIRQKALDELAKLSKQSKVSKFLT